MAIKVNAEQFYEKWKSRIQSSTADMQRGVEAVKEAPTALAAKKQDKMLANLTASVNNGKWAAGLNRVTLPMWQTAMINKGIPRIGQGAEGARDKVTLFAGELLAYEESLQNKIKTMPDLTLENNIARMIEFARGMSNFKRKR